VRIPYGNASWYFGWWSEPVDLGETIEFSDRGSALLFLLPFKSDLQFMLGLRRLLNEWNRGETLASLRDQRVLEEIAWLLSTRQLWLKRQYHESEAGASAQVTAPQPQPMPLPPPPPQPSAPPEPEPEEATFLPDFDAAAMAAVMRGAAQSGAPFCEE
jgi:hypothetical protein